MLELIQNGGVTSPKGYIAGAISAGLKSEIGALDLAILYSEDEASLASVFTTNKIESPSVTLSRKRSVSLKSHGVVVNSGCANCAVGSQGFSDAEECLTTPPLDCIIKKGNCPPSVYNFSAAFPR